MKSAFNLAFLALLALFLAACGGKKPSPLEVSESAYSAPKAGLYHAHVAYAPTEISIRYTLSPSLRAVLQPRLEALSSATAKTWNRHLPHQLASKKIGISAQFPRALILTKQDRAMHEGLFYSEILAQVDELSPINPLERPLESQAFLLSLQAKLYLIEPNSGEILWEAHSPLYEAKFESAGKLDIKALESNLRDYYQRLEQEMIDRLERAKEADLIAPLEEMRLLRGLPR